MKTFISFIRLITGKRFYLPFDRKASFVVRSFSLREKTIFYTAVVLLFATVALQIFYVNKAFMTEVPAKGGSLTEGVIGLPRFINPLLATSDADRDLTALIYSGLMRATEYGTLEYDLAETYEISEDGLVYTFTLKEDVTWSDGKPITSDDIIYTISRAQDSILKSPRRASWEGVTVEKIDDKNITFTLKQPYAPFLENTTIGILPLHIWREIDPEQFSFSKYNIEPIGSGPYKIKTIKKDDAGIPKYYDLVPFKDFALGEAYISELRIQFYSNTEDLLKAFSSGEIESINSVAPEVAATLVEKENNILQSPLPRVFGVFLNQNQANLFADKVVRRALNMALDKDEIVSKVLRGYATVIDGPIPPGALGYTPRTAREAENTGTSTPLTSTELARELLEKNGWKMDEETGVLTKETKDETIRLTFSLSTSDVPELKEVVEMIRDKWEAIGAQVDLRIFEAGALNQNVIRPRKYDALFFGEVVGRNSDLFAFWHSSQRLDPGLNIALYANITADALLEEARTISDPVIRAEKYQEFAEEVANDIPAFFIYSPDFIYILPTQIQGVELQGTSLPSERFLHVFNWYKETDRVWSIFNKDTTRK